MSDDHTHVPSPGHDHHACVRSALRAAERRCRDAGVQLTPIRRRVFELIWRSHRPSGAYTLLEQLTGEGHKPSPPTVYRALDFLLAHGLIHRISSCNAFVGCSDPEQDHLAQIFVCDDCGVAIEQSDGAVNRRIRATANDLQFAIRTQTVEIAGLCPDCREAAHAK